MKNIFIILSLILIMSSCYKEDPIVVAPEQPRIDLSDNPNDPVQHYIYTLYNKYDMLLITDPKVVDYKFNFKEYNRIIVTPPSQDPAVLIPAVEFLKKNFFDGYSDDFIKKYFPFNVILAKNITNSNGEGDYVCFASTNFVAISHITDDFGSTSEEELLKMRGQVNGAFLGSLSTTRGLLVIPEEFDQISKKYGNTLWTEPEDNSPLYEEGFTSFDPEMIDWGMYAFPSTTDDDRKFWLEWICMTPMSEIQSICASYPKMQQKFDILSAALKKIGLDVNDLAPSDGSN